MFKTNNKSIAMPLCESFRTASFAIACASGGFKAIFVHGVLSAFESANIKADAYAAASASVFATAWAIIDKAREAGINYWLEGLEIYNQTKSMSQVSLASAREAPRCTDRSTSG